MTSLPPEIWHKILNQIPIYLLLERHCIHYEGPFISYIGTFASYNKAVISAVHCAITRSNIIEYNPYERIDNEYNDDNWDDVDYFYDIYEFIPDTKGYRIKRIFSLDFLIRSGISEGTIIYEEMHKLLEEWRNNPLLLLNHFKTYGIGDKVSYHYPIASVKNSEQVQEWQSKFPK